MQLFKVYDKKGEMFEVSHEKAAQLVLNKDWSRTPPAKPAPAPAADPVQAALQSSLKAQGAAPVDAPAPAAPAVPAPLEKA